MQWISMILILKTIWEIFYNFGSEKEVAIDWLIDF